MTDLTDQDFEVAREFIAHVKKYSAVTGRNAVTAVRVLESLMPTQTPTLAEELRHIANRLPVETQWEEEVLELADRAEQIEQHNDEVAGIVEDLTEQRDEARTKYDEARAEVVRGRELIRKHKERTDRAIEERDEALAEVQRLTALCNPKETG